MRFNGVLSLFSRKQVSRIAATLLAGNDRLSIGPDLPFATVFAGAGDDTLTSANFRDVLIGGIGTDSINSLGDNDAPAW